MELICGQCGQDAGWLLYLDEVECLAIRNGMPCGAKAPIASLPNRDQCPICGAEKWRYDLGVSKWVRNCGCLAKPDKKLCAVCKSHPHKKSCGLWSPYTENSDAPNGS